MKKTIWMKISTLLVVVSFALSNSTALHSGVQDWLSPKSTPSDNPQGEGKLSPPAKKEEKVLKHGCITLESFFITVIFTEGATKKIDANINDIYKTGLESLDKLHNGAKEEGIIIKPKGWKILENGRGVMYLKFATADGSSITIGEMGMIANVYCSLDEVENATPTLTGIILCPSCQTRKAIRKAE